MHTVVVGRLITSTEAAGRARGQNSCTRTRVCVHGALRNQPRRIEEQRNAVHEALRVWPRCFRRRAPAEDISSFRLLQEIARAHKLYFTPSNHKTVTFYISMHGRPR